MEDKMFRYGYIIGKLDEVTCSNDYNFYYMTREEWHKHIKDDPDEAYDRLQALSFAIGHVLEIARIDTNKFIVDVEEEEE